MFLTPVTEEEIINIISSLKNSSAGWDEISAQIIKSTVHLFISPLTHVCNLSFLQGVFPRELKIAKVIPLYKSDDKMFVKNYRPVSVLPLFSKVLERLMYNRLLSFINKNNIFL